MPSAVPLESLAQARERFLAYVARRIDDPDLAQDVVQAGLAKAAESIGTLRREDALIPWFYAILRNEITNTYRSRAKRIEVSLPEDLDLADEQEEQRRICECFEALLPALKPEYAHLIDTLDFKEQRSEDVAARLGVTPNNLKVRHHRARQALKRRLEETCRVCAEHHCLDCSCQENDQKDEM